MCTLCCAEATVEHVCTNQHSTKFGLPRTMEDNCILCAEAPQVANVERKGDQGCFYAVCTVRRSRADANHCGLFSHRAKVPKGKVVAAESAHTFTSDVSYASSFDLGREEDERYKLGLFDVDAATGLGSLVHPDGNIENLRREKPDVSAIHTAVPEADRPWVRARDVSNAAAGLLARRAPMCMRCRKKELETLREAMVWGMILLCRALKCAECCVLWTT